MVGDVPIKSKAAKPAIGWVQVDLFAQAPLGPDGEIIGRRFPAHSGRASHAARKAFLASSRPLGGTGEVPNFGPGALDSIHPPDRLAVLGDHGEVVGACLAPHNARA